MPRVPANSGTILGSHEFWPQRRHWVKIFSLVSHGNWRLQGTLLIINCINAFLYFLLFCNPASIHDFYKEKERKVRVDVQDVQDARVTVKRKALTAGARLTITTCKLKGDLQSEGILYICDNEFMTCSKLILFPFWLFLQTAMKHFTKITLETACKNTVQFYIDQGSSRLIQCSAWNWNNHLRNPWKYLRLRGNHGIKVA